MASSMAQQASNVICTSATWKRLSSRGFRRPTFLGAQAQNTNNRLRLGRRRSVVTSANMNDDDYDWDSAWKTFDKQTKAKRKTGQAGPAPRYGRGIPKYESDPVRDQIRRDENLILNAWTSTKFTTNGLIGMILSNHAASFVYCFPPPQLKHRHGAFSIYCASVMLTCHFFKKSR